ncbi:TolC family protein [Phenylobacterium sp.]|jgi:outer membrane protein TolC|uniref:TolC family protein n=1 Tax=Phenylobacterium sp. TaxID=1871053 RepID=UPI002E33DA20|nr:TolC family protein [Phenylobacterium sp.]HEX3366099.1 TolC family protein [Phenylobacterium sp.]
METPGFDRLRCAGLAAAGLMLAMAASAAEAQASSPAAGRLGLADALDYASANYPSVKAALEQRVAAERDVDVARAAYLPQVNLLYQINKSTVNNFTGLLLPQSVIPSISGPVLAGSSKSVWNSGDGVLATWRPFDFGYRAAKVDAAREAANAASQSVALTRLEVLTATSNAYMNLAAAQSLAKVAQANLERLQAFAGASHVLVDNKLRAGVEAAQADAAEALARATLISARNNVEQQQATLAKLVNRPASQIIIDDAPLNEAPAEIGAASARGVDTHPSALAEAARVKQQDAQLRALDRSFAPQIDMVGSASGRGGGKTATGDYRGGDAGLNPDVGNWAVGVQVTVPLGSLFSFGAQEGAQRARVRAERDRYQQTLGDLTEQLAQAQSTLTSAREIAKITPVALQAARLGETQQRARFQSGLATAVDVTAAEAVLAQAESQDAIARLNVWRALAGLAAAQGDMAPLRAAAPK